jgi:hypothetical protein
MSSECRKNHNLNIAQRSFEKIICSAEVKNGGAIPPPPTGLNGVVLIN